MGPHHRVIAPIVGAEAHAVVHRVGGSQRGEIRVAVSPGELALQRRSLEAVLKCAGLHRVDDDTRGTVAFVDRLDAYLRGAGTDERELARGRVREIDDPPFGARPAVAAA